jgi:hypothetical protein
MKQDKSCFLKSNDVARLYEETLVQVHALNDIRAKKRDEQNQGSWLLFARFELMLIALQSIRSSMTAFS